MPGPRKTADRPNRSPGLVALGSAAVLAVYSAGYLRTRPAAARFAMPAQAPVPASAPAMLVQAPATATAPTHSHARAPRRASAPASAVAPAPAPPTPDAAPPAPDAPPTSPAPDTPPPSPAAPSSQSAADASAAGDDAPAVIYKDGTWLGWGSSRHGDIQAEVVVEKGRIVSARIAQCLTRYPCSWLAPLPSEVVSRQSAQVDYISGATDSSYAFFYALVDALGKAK